MLASKQLHHYLILILGLLSLQGTSQRGLKFHGGENPIDERTSYNMFENTTVTFSDHFAIDFDLFLYPARPIGYILRIKNMKSNKIFNLFYDGQGSNVTFRFNEEGKNSLIIARMNKEKLLNSNWFNLKLAFDLRNDSIHLEIDKQQYESGSIGLPKEYHPQILFGKSDYIIDVPSFAIKNLSISSNKKRYYFELNENEGNDVFDTEGEAVGKVTNPEWLVNYAYHWKFITSFKSSTVAGANYNPVKNNIYYFNQDSIHIYNVRTEETKLIAFDEKCPVPLKLGTNFIDQKHDELYSYEVYLEDKDDSSTVASLNLSTFSWTTKDNQQLPIQLHHHGSYYPPDNNEYTIFGGFGNMHYSKDFYSYNIEDQKWKTLESYTGDFLSPRYFSSVGYSKESNSVYIFGGMGNESGEQIVGRKYYYDFYMVNLNTKQISKLWSIPWKNDNVVPVRGMVILNDSIFYTLCYPEHYTESFLRLYQFSIKDGSYEVLGDSIPIYSDRITTNANLYYDAKLEKLFVLVQEFEDDIASELKVYSLAFPPIKEETLTDYKLKTTSGIQPFFLIFSSLITLIIVYYVVRARSKGNSYLLRQKGHKSTVINAPKPNSIYLFGDFRVLDRNNKDITYMFSAKLKEIFCLILRHSDSGGITSKNLSNELWPDKTSDKVKNLRGVTINHLRKALGELDGIELIYERGCFKLVQTDLFYCDYSRFCKIISSKKVGENQHELLNIVSRGKFLMLADASTFDVFKQEVENKLEPVLLMETENAYNSEAYQMTIDFSDFIFNIDPLNETALKFQIKALNKLKMHEEAQIRYNAFVSEYKKIMGSNYTNPDKIMIKNCKC